jgi:hypothetical protein
VSGKLEADLYIGDFDIAGDADHVGLVARRAVAVVVDHQRGNRHDWKQDAQRFLAPHRQVSL